MPWLELLSACPHTIMHGVLHISYTMCTRGSPDIYTLSPRACGPRASGAYIRQTTRAHGITIKCNTVNFNSTLLYTKLKSTQLCKKHTIGRLSL